MFGTAWLTLRQAREAIATGRLEEANRLLGQPSVRGHKKAFALQKQVVNGFIERAERHLRTDAVPQAWEDLRLAEVLAPTDPVVEKFRKKLLSLGLAEIKAALEVGRPGRAAETVARLRDRGVRPAEVEPYDEIARRWLLARESADAGEFGVAVHAVDRISRLLPPPTTGLDDFRLQLEERHASFQKCILELHAAAADRRWREVVQLAGQVLAAAPQSAEARKARADAWKAIEPDTTLPGDRPPSAAEIELPVTDSRGGGPRRLMLWIDGVGGYLICLSNRVTFGQATGDAPVDVPLLADVSRMHATLSRDTEGYIIEAARPVLVNGKPQTKTSLLPGDRVTLGSSCQFLFQQPVPVSASARLELVSGHKLPYSVSGVLLMADSLVLGPGEQVHVPLPDRRENLVLFRHKDGVGLRCPGDFHVDGQRCKDRGVLGLHASATGSDFSLALEPAGRF
ncbi:MAG: FHA domain-containing protein [Gemmataceae bacterium]